MEENEYINRIEALGYKASDELVAAVQDLHAKQLTDDLIDRAYAEFRRAKTPPPGKAAKKAKASNAEPTTPAKPEAEGGKQ